MRRQSFARSLVASAAAMLLHHAAYAMSFADAVNAARNFDPTFRAAGYELDAVRLGVPIARSSLLPQVALSASNQEVVGSRTFPNGLNQEVTTRVDYSAPQAALQARLSIFNYEAWARLRQAEAQSEGAEATYRARGLELVDRVATAYLLALIGRTQRALAETEMKSVQAQLDRARQRFARGEGTRTEEAQAVAALELARYRMIEASDQLELALVRLRRVTGQEPTTMFEAPADFTPAPLQPVGIQEWIDIALAQNPQLEARRRAIEAARQGVERNRAGHLPRLDLVGSLAKSKNDSLANLNQSSTLKSVGVQLQVPIFSGFGVDASVKQAEAERKRAEQDLHADREQIELEVQRLYVAASSGITRVDALRRSVAASETALEGTTRALEAGLATSADVLDAQTKLFAANRDLIQARYEYVASRMRLLAQVGTPLPQLVADIDSLLTVKFEPPGRRKP